MAVFAGAVLLVDDLKSSNAIHEFGIAPNYPGKLPLPQSHDFQRSTEADSVYSIPIWSENQKTVVSFGVA
jgi:hypothetical protein